MERKADKEFTRAKHVLSHVEGTQSSENQRATLSLRASRLGASDLFADSLA